MAYSLMLRRAFALLLIPLLTLPLAATVPQRSFLSRFLGGTPEPYDGRFTLARLWYARYSGWSFDWPEMEENLGRLLPEITALHPHPNRFNIFRMDDPELLKYPVAYLSEPGYWFPSDTEVEGLRTYIDKGGFLIVDDFHFPEEWAVFESAMRQVLPNGKIERLTIEHPVFNAFFRIETLDVPYPGPLGQRGLMGEFYGIYKDNDPTKHLIVVINYNMDIGDYMEHSARGMYLVDPTNEAFKFGINYLIYGLTH
jgi:hypothetical protein